MTHATSTPHVGTEKTRFSVPKNTPPPAKNRVWKAPRFLPASLAHEEEHPIYVLWRYGATPNGKGKYPKLPFSPHKVDKPGTRRGYTYKAADPTSPASWGTFAQCLAAAADWRGWFDGIGRVLQPNEVGIDYDDCYDAGGALAELVAVDLAEASGYKERSVSQTGLHIIALGQLSEAIKTDAVEIYPGGSGRFFVLTGDELPGSTTPAPAQALITRLITTHGNTRARSGQPSAAPRQLETVALTPELASAVAEAHGQLGDLLADLRDNMTSQLFNLLTRGIFPPALKDTSASGARSVVVAQLQRAPRRREAPEQPRYTDAEVYTLARELWRRKGYEGALAGKEQRLAADCRRLIATYRPGAPARAKRAYKIAPEPLAYLTTMADAANAGAVLLNRDERARLGGVPRATAQRIELHLVEIGLAELGIYNLTGPATKGRRGMLQITPKGYQALGIVSNESVILGQSAEDESVNDSAPESAILAIAPVNNTLLCDGSASSPPAPTPHKHTHKRVLPAPNEPPALEPSLWHLVELALGDDTRAGLPKVRRYLADNGLSERWPAPLVERTYRQVLAKRAVEREREGWELERATVQALRDDELIKAVEARQRGLSRNIGKPREGYHRIRLQIADEVRRRRGLALPGRVPGYRVRPAAGRVQLLHPGGQVTWHADEEAAWCAAIQERGLAPQRGRKKRALPPEALQLTLTA